MKAVIFGAGNIGRGFLGHLLAQSGYEIIFVEVVQEVIDRLNTDGGYPIHVVGEENWTYQVERVRAAHASDVGRISQEITTAHILATAVGVNALPAVAPTLAEALRSRFDAQNTAELNVIICENIIHSGEHLKALVLQHLPGQYHPLVEEKVGWVAGWCPS
jgi:mannitol-1-phosphate 5-dehydrogenase